MNHKVLAQATMKQAQKRTLSQSKANSHLTEFDFSNNKISNSGARSICWVYPHTHVQFFDGQNLRGNNINSNAVDLSNCQINASFDQVLLALHHTSAGSAVDPNIYLLSFLSLLLVVRSFFSTLNAAACDQNVSTLS